MARAHHDRRTRATGCAGCSRQPPPGFYSRPAVYLSGDRMEIEHFLHGVVLLMKTGCVCGWRRGGSRYTAADCASAPLTAARLTVQGAVFCAPIFPMNREAIMEAASLWAGCALPPGTAAPRHF